MDDRTAYRLAETMNGTWPTTGPTRAAWHEHLLDLDEAAATVAFHKLRSGTNHRNLLAAFNDEYATARRVRSMAAPKVDHDDSPVMGPTEYFDRLAWRAGTGDPEAIEIEREWSTPAATEFLRGGRVIDRP